MALLRRPRDPVLIVLHGDGWIEAYAEKHIDVRVVNAPWCPGAKGELLGEEYVHRGLPDHFRQIYVPGRRVATSMHVRLLPSDIIQRQADVQALRKLAEIKLKLLRRAWDRPEPEQQKVL